MLGLLGQGEIGLTGIHFKDLHISSDAPCAIWRTLIQGFGVGVRVGVARSRSDELGVGVGIDQTASTPTPERFV